MRTSSRNRRRASSGTVIAAVLSVMAAFTAACSSGPGTAAATATVAPSITTVALGTANPAPGDCTTNTSEAASSVGSVEIQLTPDSFAAVIQLQTGTASTTYGVFLQQVPGACPQLAANAGSLTTDATGHGRASASVPRKSGATVFFVQLVPRGSGPGQFTSDRLVTAP